MHISMLYFTLKEKNVFKKININVPITKPWLLPYFFLITLNLNSLSPWMILEKTETQWLGGSRWSIEGLGKYMGQLLFRKFVRF